jgi:hypothetical protein
MAVSSASVDTNTLLTVGVFVTRYRPTAVNALLTMHRFAAPTLSAIANDDPALEAWMADVFGGSRTASAGAAALRVAGPLVPGAGFPGDGVDGLMRASGFQSHDGRIFARLVERGGVLVAVTSDARAADALSVMHAYGGGNAAIAPGRDGSSPAAGQIFRCPDQQGQPQ